MSRPLDLERNPNWMRRLAAERRAPIAPSDHNFQVEWLRSGTWWMVHFLDRGRLRRKIVYGFHDDRAA